MDFKFAKDNQGKPYLQVGVEGYALITNPLLNKGMAFTPNEREEFGLIGILPPAVNNLETQLARSYETFSNKTSPLEKHIYLRDLQDSNETLFYRLLIEHLEEIMPIVYTPTVGLGCVKFSHIYRRPRGVFLSYPDRHHLQKILDHPRFDYVSIIVVSDGERILGLGDQGAGGMGIPIGKLSLYTACAGIHPAATLPILLDAGTNNESLLNDTQYIGWHHERLEGPKYDEFIDLFVTAIQKRFPNIVLQWEDVAQHNANRVLARYRDQLCTFNDDIQGTAAMVGGAILAAIKLTGIELINQKIVIVGAGSAGCGIAELIKSIMMEKGLSEKEAYNRFYLIDKNGLLFSNNPSLLPFQKMFGRIEDECAHWQFVNPTYISLKDVVKNLHPTVLIGTSGQYGIFSEEIVKEMATHVERPIIFPLSNPTEKSEASPADLMKWTNERAIIGTGSPFECVMKHGKPFRVDQTNNSYIFPGLGLGLIAVKAKRVTNEMLVAAAKALAECSPSKKNRDDNLLPSLAHIRHVSLKVAVRVAEAVLKSEFAGVDQVDDLEEHIKKIMWFPEYVPYKKR